jgi:psiF repeat
MNSRGPASLRIRLAAGMLLALSLGAALAAAADSGSTLPRPVTATPPLLAVPATPVSKNVQQRMRACNATADARKLAPSAREIFIRSCMAPHRPRAPSRAGSEAKPNP